ncbi:aminotransferase class IV [uncultured Chitinophaga sp.]|uniref:aminotransferase class IV n=1 Tax=uncultured Chitinophaga sp. TaxID=339340 RepID=UPI002615415D|nr:aminotransferase class IV [uncultured Chitinophaga sp.]
MSDPIVYINDTFLPASQAALQISDLAIQRGYGIFDFFKTLDHLPVFLDEHLDRFYHSAEQMRLAPGKDRDQLREVIRELAAQNNIANAGIRITLTGGYSPDGYSITRPNLVITQQPLQLPDREQFRRGLRLISYPHQRQMPQVKSLDYLMAIWLQPLIREKGADDVLYQYNGLVSECPRANFFIVTGNDTVVTSSQPLKGIIRMKTLEIACKQFKVEERELTLEEVYQAREAFITSTTKHILPVVQLDGRAIGDGEPGNITTMLNMELDDLIYNDEA